jgi:signal transduction histidine kinase
MSLPLGTREDRSDPAGREIAKLRAQLDSAEAERRRIAETLHATVSQTLSGMQFMARVIAKKLAASNSDVAKDVAELADLAQRTVDELHEVTRGLTASPMKRVPAGSNLKVELRERKTPR